MEYNFKLGDKVNVIRKIGENGIPHVASGIIERFSDMIKINGEKTAYIKYDDGKGAYWHKISTLTPA